MLNDYLFFMGVGVWISFCCVLKLVNEMRVFLGISEVHSTSQQVATIIVHMSNMCPIKTSFSEDDDDDCFYYY